MPAVSYPHLILPLLLVIGCIIEQGESNFNRQRRQAAGGDNRNIGNSNGFIASNNVQFNPTNNQNIPASNIRNDQQLSGKNLLPSSQGQGQPVRSQGFYNSPAFKPPTFSGEKPVGWFDTKYPNWVSNQNSQADQNNMVDGKNAPPSSLQGDSIQARREDGGPLFLQKVAKQYMGKGEKAYNFGQYNRQRDRGSVCTNRQNFDGYTFGKFPCPLPISTGMSQLDQFCCGPANYQYCCNAREFNLNQGTGFDDNSDHRHSKHSHYTPSRSRALAIILPIVGVLVVAGALILVFLYYKKTRNAQNKNLKPSNTTRSNESYSAVPQVPPAEQPIITRREQQKTTVQA